MYQRTTILGNILVAIGAILLISMIIPKGFWTVLIGIALVAVGLMIRKQTC